MQSLNKQKTDGYIKNQSMRLKEMRLNILLKMSCVIVPMAILMAILWGIFSINPPPEKWESAQITFSSISRESLPKRRGTRGTYVLNTTDGDGYILGMGTDEMEVLKKQLVPNRQYSIVYCENAFTRITKSLSSDNEEFIELEKSISEWETDQQSFYIILVAMTFLMVVGSILIYFTWCKKECQQIQKIKIKISERLEKRIFN